jgi:hypothetical protein
MRKIYMKFVSAKIKLQEKSNEQIVLDYWKQVSIDGSTTTKYESLSKKMIEYSQEENITPKEFAINLLELDGIAKSQVLKFWVIKAERQNLNEEWKKEYIRATTKMNLILLSKSGKDSLYLDENFNIVPKINKKTQSEKSKGIKTFDFLLVNSKYPKTGDYNGILVVDKTVKVTGGSQMDVQKEIDNTIEHLCKDPFKRKYLVLLDGEFFYNYVQENKNKCENVFISTTDELVEDNKKLINPTS